MANFKFKLIAVCGDENHTKEYDNRCNTREEAEAIAQRLLEEYVEDYPDTYIACYHYDDDIKYPDDSYPVWSKDYFGDIYWRRMYVRDCFRIGINLWDDDELDDWFNE